MEEISANQNGNVSGAENQNLNSGNNAGGDNNKNGGSKPLPQEGVSVKEVDAITPISGKSVLLVEDDKFLSDLVGKKLEKEGLKVFKAIEGLEGFKSAKENKPDLILLDIILQGMNGFEALAKLKEDKATKDIPVIILSNLGQRQEVDKGISLGAVDFLIKAHFTPNEVVAKISKVLNKK